MSVVDFHVHIGSREGWGKNDMDHLKQYNPKVYDRFDEYMTPEGLKRHMASQGVDLAVLLAENSPLQGTNVSDEFVAKFCKGQDCLIGFGSVNPRIDPNPVEKLQHGIFNLGLKGYKLLPSYHHYYINDSKMYPFYAKAEELDVPLLFHIGSSTYWPCKLKYCDPVLLDEVAVDFPGLKLIMAHGGRGFWYDACFFLAQLHKNVYVEISGLPPQNLLKYFPNFERNADKIIFGSDWPSIPSEIGKNVEVIRSLPLKKDILEKVLRLNALKVLNLK